MFNSWSHYDRILVTGPQRSGTRIAQPGDDFSIIVLDICNGINFLHDKDILHRDLKSANVLIYKKDDELHAKITDFGLSKEQTAANKMATSKWMGTPQYLAPDLFTASRPEYTKKCDVYSTGVIFWEIRLEKCLLHRKQIRKQFRCV